MASDTSNLVERFQSHVIKGNVKEVQRILEDAISGVHVDTPLRDQIGEERQTQRTALQIAIDRDWTPLVELLLQKDADVNANPDTETGESALQIAVRKYPLSGIPHKLLRRGADVNAPAGGPAGETALHTALRRDDIQTLELLLSYEADWKSVASIVQGSGKDSLAAHLIKRHGDKLTVPRPRRLIVCCDGTWMRNDTDQPLSNVARIALCFTDCDRKHVKKFVQIVHYQPGVGTSSFAPYNLYEGAFAKAISQDIRDAYGFICDNFASLGDEIILIGFSRGAFTVRALASLINDVGVLTGAGRYCVNEVYDLWEKQLSPTALASYKEYLVNHHLTRKDVRIRACAVWDTVASIGAKLPKWLPQIPSRKLSFVDSTLCSNIDYAFQALALDEKRFHFQPVLWKRKSSEQHLTQCWFRGSHSDVGGGNHNFGLANFALAWMISKLQQNQLASFDGFKISQLATHLQLLPRLLGETRRGECYQLPEQSFNVYNSYTKRYWLAGTEPRKPGAVNHGADWEEYIHESVFRLGNDPNIILDINKFNGMAREQWVHDDVEYQILKGWRDRADNDVIRRNLNQVLGINQAQDEDPAAPG